MAVKPADRQIENRKKNSYINDTNTQFDICSPMFSLVMDINSCLNKAGNTPISIGWGRGGAGCGAEKERKDMLRAG